MFKKNVQSLFSRFISPIENFLVVLSIPFLFKQKKEKTESTVSEETPMASIH